MMINNITQSKSVYDIIIVDDDSEDISLMKLCLLNLNEGERVLFIPSGSALIEYLEQVEPSKYPSLVVLDYIMPSMNGIDTLQHIKRNPFISKIPHIIYSTTITDQVQKVAKDLGILLCLKKGNSYEKITEQMRYFLELIDMK